MTVGHYISATGVRRMTKGWRRGPSRLLAVLATVAVMLALVPPGARATPEGMEFGARVGPRTGEVNQSAVLRMEDAADRKLDVVREFLVWDSPFPDTYHSWLRDTDRKMIVSVTGETLERHRDPLERHSCCPARQRPLQRHGAVG